VTVKEVGAFDVAVDEKDRRVIQILVHPKDEDTNETGVVVVAMDDLEADAVWRAHDRRGLGLDRHVSLVHECLLDLGDGLGLY
jgi:hypothetical protein